MSDVLPWLKDLGFPAVVAWYVLRALVGELREMKGMLMVLTDRKEKRDVEEAVEVAEAGAGRDVRGRAGGDRGRAAGRGPRG